ncbi:murein biosynthesis integral membrane protein MurJ [Sporosarcina ureilytica]|uniref:murein biosynthesis integral membrane protein MurJ n=1 Tax=Sporosarcina ureilytica TaxID=298596 RepID=UPI00094CAC40|nr:murein biosynthesis integral membrane protein MurJ [Sporosarcina ureilytica]
MHKLIKIIGTVAVINIVARLLGFLREVAIGYKYGTSTMADAIAVAYTIPNFIYLVVGGALTTAFISVYHSSDSDKNYFVRKAFTSVLVTVLTIVVLIILLTDPILHVFFSELNPDNNRIVRNLFLWMMPSTIFLVLSTWMSGLLNLNGLFTLSSVAILIYNLLFVLIGFTFTSVFGPLSYGIGAFVAAVVMGGFLYVGLRKSQPYSFKPLFTKSPDVIRMWRIALPILLGGASLQFYFIIHRIVAAGLEPGVISSVNYASKLTGFPQAIMMTAVTTVIYPLLSKKEGEGDDKTIRSLYRKGMVYLVSLLVPVTVIAYIFAEPLVTLVFGYGNFTQESIDQTVPIFKVFALSMFFLASNTYITRFYYAKGNSVIPVLFSIINVFVVNLIVIYSLLGSFGASAIAYGTVFSSASNFVMLFIYAKMKWRL